MHHLYHEIANLLQNNESLVIATIIDKLGSAPRSAGAKMIIKSDGSIIGTIGGGRLEADVLRLARDVFHSKTSVRYFFSLTGKDVAGMDMICGGEGEVLLDFIAADDRNNQRIFLEVTKVIEKGEKAWLVTSLNDLKHTDAQAPKHCLVTQAGSVMGCLQHVPNLLLAPTLDISKKPTYVLNFEEQHFLIEFIKNVETVYIFGAGHIAQKIVPLAESVGFRTVVLDDRIEFASHKRFPETTKVVHLESFNKLDEIFVNEESYLVIVTRGHLHDKDVLAWALKTNAAYIGMIGSYKKRENIYAALIEEKFDKSDFDRVCSPIGLEIGAETPAEIAVSIVGELIKVRRNKARLNL